MKFLFALSALWMLIFVSNCSNKKNNKAYDEVLDSPAFSALTDSIKNDPENDDLYFRRAILLNSNNYPDLALRDFQKAWALDKKEKYAFGLGNILLEKKPDSAIYYLNEAVVQFPGSVLLHITLGRALISENRHSEAFQIAENLLSVNPRQVDVLKMKADILSYQGKKPAAIQSLEMAYQWAPHDVELNYMLSLALATTGNSRVINLADSLIKADSLGIHAEPYYYKGIYFSVIGQKDKALTMFDEAIKRDYNFLDSYIEKGALLFDMNKYHDALKVFNLCLTISPKYADAYYWIAKTQEALGKKEEAISNYERAFNLDRELIEAKEAVNRLSK